MPRSPARDLSDRYTGKRGYFRNPEALAWWRRTLAKLALVLALAWVVVDVVQPHGASYAHTHGKLANPHAAFNDNCAACHVTHSAGDFSVGAVFHTRERWHDLTCEKCHTGAPHHASATADAKTFHNQCSNCHHDHNGPLNSLVRISDNHCTRCHSDLDSWHDRGKGAQYQNKITSFVSDHPEFRSLKNESQPRTLTFSHAVHMNPGQAYAGGREAMTVKKLRDLNREQGAAVVARYAPGATDATLIQLDCASCHKLDPGRGTEEFNKLKAALDANGEPTKSLLPARPEGAYFLPVNYDVSCRSCHPLSAPEGTVAGKVVPRFDVAHRRQPADLLGELKAGYLRGMIATGNPAVAVPPEPGGRFDTPPTTGAKTLADETDRLATSASKLMFEATGTCAKCHKTDPADAKSATPRVAPVPDRTVWFVHAKFNHAAHRGATCATCHPGTSKGEISAVDAAKPEPVQIEGLQSCRACHSPLNTKVTVGGETLPGGGVRHNCTDCHRYHHGDQPMQGRGGESWFPKEPRGLADWLKGK